MTQGWREGGTPERPAVFFDGPEAFRAWLEEHHDTAPELWMGLRKRHVADRGLTWQEAVPVALCFGWIDSVAQRIDDDSRRQRWTPRRRGSVWSAVNVAHVERLLAEGLMHPAGIAAYEARTAERTGVYSYERPTDLAEEHRAAIEAVPAAVAFWARLRPATASWSPGGCRVPSRRPPGNGAWHSWWRTARPAGWCRRSATARRRAGSGGRRPRRGRPGRTSLATPRCKTLMMHHVISTTRRRE